MRTNSDPKKQTQKKLNVNFIKIQNIFLSVKPFREYIFHFHFWWYAAAVKNKWLDLRTNEIRMFFRLIKFLEELTAYFSVSNTNKFQFTRIWKNYQFFSLEIPSTHVNFFSSEWNFLNVGLKARRVLFHFV